jgi:hypothetical protein
VNGNDATPVAGSEFTAAGMVQAVPSDAFDNRYRNVTATASAT